MHDYKFERVWENPDAAIEKGGTVAVSTYMVSAHSGYSIIQNMCYPHPGLPINYPDGAPEFKRYLKENYMGKFSDFDLLDNSLDFQTINDFKWCIKAGEEVEFMWKDKLYCVFGKLKKAPEAKEQVCICKAD